MIFQMNLYKTIGFINKMMIILFSILISFASIAEAKNGISALGFIEPENGIINLSANSTSIVAELRVATGDEVKAGQILALLDNYKTLQASVKQVEAEIAILNARLNEVKAGASKEKIKAQKERVRRFKIELKTADAKCHRAEILLNKQAISRVEKEDKCLKKQSLQGQLREAQATLKSVAEVRGVTVTVSKAELAKSKAVLVKTKAKLEQAVVRAPVAGRILKIHTKTGERIDSQGILQLGQTASMWVRAEVYETDINKVSVGQQATITSDGFLGELKGTVEKIGWLIGKKQVKPLNPSASSDSRVVEIKIKLSEKDSPKVSRLTNLQVTVVIKTTKQGL